MLTSSDMPGAPHVVYAVGWAKARSCAPYPRPTALVGTLRLAHPTMLSWLPNLAVRHGKCEQVFARLWEGLSGAKPIPRGDYRWRCRSIRRMIRWNKVGRIIMLEQSSTAAAVAVNPDGLRATALEAET